MDNLVYAPGEDESFVALSRTPQGKLFKKHILSTGTLFYPGVKGGKVDIDEGFLTKLAENFSNKVCPIVQVPVVGDNNAHSEDPLRNIGEVVDLKVENGKAYAYIDARDETAANKLGKTLLGASAMLSLDYTDTRTSRKSGPTLLHVAITNRPHVVELDEFEELLAASADSSSEKAVLLSAAEPKEALIMDLDEFIAKGRDDFGIDIPDLQKKAEEADSYAKLSGELQKTLADSGVLKLSADDSTPSAEDFVAAVAQVAQDRVDLTAKVDTLVQKNIETEAESRIESLVSDGFIPPVKRDAYKALLLSNPEQFEAIIPEKPLVELSAESGQEVKDLEHDDAVDGEIARLSAFAAEQGLLGKSN